MVPNASFIRDLQETALALTAVVLIAATLVGNLFINASQSPAAESPKVSPKVPPVSTFAPIDDLVAQVDVYVDRIAKHLSNADSYDDDAQLALEREANTLIVLTQALGLHDKEHPLKSHAGKIIHAAKNLAGASEDYGKATAALAAVDAAFKGEGDAHPLTWKKIASLGQIMEESSVIDARLRRSIEPRRFARRASRVKGEAVTLAAIAQATLIDTHEVKNPAEVDTWYEYSKQMREASYNIYTGITTGNAKATGEAAERLTISCETCHEVFRDAE